METIPEDDDESAIEESDYEIAQEPPPSARLSSIVRPSQPFPVSPDNRCNSSSGLRHSAEYPAPSPPRAPPEAWEPYFSPADALLAHRDQQVPSRDPRSIPARSSYRGDKKTFVPYHPRRKSRPISRQVRFTTRQLHVDLDDDNDERGIDRGGGHWDKEYERDRDRNGGWDGGWDIQLDPQRLLLTTNPYSASRHPSYPSPSPGGSRPAQPYYNILEDRDYNIVEDRESELGSSHERYNWGLPDIWEYPKLPGNARPGPCQSSYERPRDDPDIEFTVDNGS